MPLAHFHPTIQRWFEGRFGAPTEAQREGWPRIASGRHTLISAPTGTGKTIAGYLSAIDGLARQGADLKNQTQVLYISPLRALSNDVQKNLQRPLEELRNRSVPSLELAVQVDERPSAQPGDLFAYRRLAGAHEADQREVSPERPYLGNQSIRSR